MIIKNLILKPPFPKHLTVNYQCRYMSRLFRWKWNHSSHSHNSHNHNNSNNDVSVKYSPLWPSERTASTLLERGVWGRPNNDVYLKCK